MRGGARRESASQEGLGVVAEEDNEDEDEDEEADEKAEGEEERPSPPSPHPLHPVPFLVTSHIVPSPPRASPALRSTPFPPPLVTSHILPSPHTRPFPRLVPPRRTDPPIRSCSLQWPPIKSPPIRDLLQIQPRSTTISTDIH